MSTDHEGVSALLKILVERYTSSNFSSPQLPRIAVNIIYGLQNCSCSDESALFLLTASMNTIEEAIQQLMISQHSLPINELMSVHQTLCLTQMVLPGLNENEVLRTKFAHIIASTNALITNCMDLHLQPPTAIETRLVKLLKDLLADDPFEVVHGTNLHGFEATAVIQLSRNVVLHLADGTRWNSSVLNVEVQTPIAFRPTRVHYNSLRNRYLKEVKGVHIETVNTSTDSSRLSSGGGRSWNILQSYPALFACLYPLTAEDKAVIDQQLGLPTGMGKGILSTLHERCAMGMTNVQDAGLRYGSMHGASVSESYLDDRAEFPPFVAAASSMQLEAAHTKSITRMRVGWFGPRFVFTSSMAIPLKFLGKQSILRVNRSSDQSPSSSVNEQLPEDDVISTDSPKSESAVCAEIELLERQLEIARMEAKLLELKVNKARLAGHGVIQRAPGVGN